MYINLDLNAELSQVVFNATGRMAMARYIDAIDVPLEIEHAFFVKGVVALVAIVVEELDNGASELVLWVFLCSEGSEKEKRGSDS